MKKYIPLFEEFNNLNEAKFAPRNTMTFDEFVNRFNYDKSQLRIILKFFAEDETVYSYMDDNIKYFINKNYIPVNTEYTGLTLYQSKKDGSAIIEEWSGGAEGYYVYYTQASKLQESTLNEAASKKIKISNFKLDYDSQRLYATKTAGLSFSVKINDIITKGIFRKKFRYTYEGVDINELQVNGKYITICDGGGSYRSFEINVGSFEEKEKQPKNLAFTGPYFDISHLGSEFKRQLTNIVENKPELLTPEFKETFNIF